MDDPFGTILFCIIYGYVDKAKVHDIIEKTPRGYRCKIYSGMLDYLFDKFLNGDQKTIDVLRAWGN